MAIKSWSDSLDNGLQHEIAKVSFVGAASSTTGCILQPVAGQASAATRVYLASAGTSNASAAVMTAAIAQKLIRISELSGTILPPFNTLAAERELAITGIVNYFANLPAVTNGSASIGWAICGLDLKDIATVKVERIPVEGAASTGAPMVLFDLGATKTVISTVTLGATSNIISSGTTEIAIGTNNMVLIPRLNLAFGVLTVGAAATYAITANDLVELQIDAMV